MSLAHFTVATQDGETTAAFFEQIFLWKRIHVPSNTDVLAIWLDIGAGQQMHVLQIEGFEVSPFEKEFGRHFAFFFPAAELPKIRERLAAAGVDVIPAIRPTPFERFFFQDPTGYMWEVIDRDHFVRE
ncbi:VOC family protein [Blastopirellula sp. JC732]|uniref:VOC family protein n=1 Tax=Blastopirellula sediminis TaxID=2894196 RepID=A0A9X1SIC2_9BACT|nr:VOC family protein [Blastopirellula sediminis]MCC9606030.1 VOC family protein [Blastopirellula sediminis]MCC9630671.1 VOC family protein [Blastopirellula sediminis]